jgi:hypothetical protein
MAPKAFFILSCARSGSTSLAKILDTASNGCCAVEPMPNLNRETRDLMEGRLPDPERVVRETVVRRVSQPFGEGLVYGEKNVTYAPFLPWLDKLLDARFVFLRRDGRDVVRSLINWHEQKFGSIYRECREPARLSLEAMQSAAHLPAHEDSSDYSRPRPGRDDPLYDRWEEFSRLEMCAYYWSRINRLYRENLSRIDPARWTELDFTAPDAEAILRVAEFCGLRGLSRQTVAQLLARRINSLADRGSSPGVFPDWKFWDSGRRRRFDALAAETMRELGYYDRAGTEWRPKEFGEFWKGHGGDIDWYRWMYNSRRAMHEDLIAWVARRDQAGDRIETIADFGCGLGVGYSDAFGDKRYIGIDIDDANVQWCRVNRAHSGHEYHCRDFISTPLTEPADLVFSSGTIDNVYDVDACLGSMVASSRRWIHLTCYRGWFPDRDEHAYNWNEEHACFYTDVSASRIRETLRNLGCREISVGKVPTGRTDIRFETRVIARVPLAKGR